VIPEDSKVRELDAAGIPLVELPDDSLLKKAVSEIAKKLGLL